jgi:hypothetical protein
MPLGTYGSKLGRTKKPKNAREEAIRRGGQKGRFSKTIGKLMTGKASPHTSRDESPIGRAMAKAKKIRKMPRQGKKKKG